MVQKEVRRSGGKIAQHASRARKGQHGNQRVPKTSHAARNGA